MLGLVVLESIKEERGRLLNHVLGQENIHDPVKVNKSTTLLIGELSSKLGTLLGVDPHDVLEELSVIRLVAYLLGVGQNLVELASLSESSDNLVGDVGLEVDVQSQTHVVWSDDVSKLLGGLQFLFVHPLLQQMLAVLLQDGSDKLHTLVTVQGTLIEQHTEVLQNDRHLAGLRSVLEAGDGLRSTEETTGGVGGDLGSLREVTRVDESVKLLLVKVIGSRETGPRSKFYRKRGHCGVVHQVVNDRALVNADGQNLTLTVDTDQASTVRVRSSGEDGLAGDAVHEDASTGLEVVEVDETILRHEVNDVVLGGHLHGHGEVINCLLREVHLHSLLLESGVRLLVVDLGNLQLGACLGSNGKGEEMVGKRGALNVNVGERSSVTLDKLRNAALLGVKLHRTDNPALLLTDTNHDHPLLLGVNAVVDDLTSLSIIKSQYEYSTPTIQTKQRIHIPKG